MSRVDAFAYRNLTTEELSTIPVGEQATDAKLYRSKQLALEAAKRDPTYATACELHLIHVFATLTEKQIEQLASGLPVDLETMEVKKIGLSKYTIPHTTNTQA